MDRSSVLGKRTRDTMQSGVSSDSSPPQSGISTRKPARTTLDAELAKAAMDSKQEHASTVGALEQALDPPAGLDLTKLSPALQGKMASLGEDGWKALDTLGGGIQKVVLPASPQGTPLSAFCAGLGHLGSLRQVSLIAAPTGLTSIDLGALENPQLTTIEVRVPDHPKGHITDAHLRVRAPDGTDVFATTNQRPSMHKSLVTYVKDGKEVGSACVLLGMPYYRQAKDLVREGMSPLEADRKALDTNHNLVVQFSGSDVFISCQHLGTQWLMERHAYNIQKKQAQSVQDSKTVKPAFEFTHFKTAEAIRRHMDHKTVMREREGLLAQKEWLDGIWFYLDEFAAEIPKRFDGVKPADPALFGLSLDKHFLTFELQMKPVTRGTRQCVDYVMTLYDPNGTMTQARLAHGDPRRFRDRSLAGWVGAELLSQYNPGATDRRIIYPYPPVTASQALAEVLRRPQHPLAGHPVRMAEGDQSDLAQCHTQQLRALPGGGPDRLLCVCDDFGGICGLRGYRVAAESLERQGIPLAAAYQASLATGAIYIVPADQLCLRSTGGASISEEGGK